MKRLTRAPNFNFSFPRFAVVLVVGSIPPNISFLDNPCSRSRNPDRTRVYKNQSNSIKIHRPFAKYEKDFRGCVWRVYSPSVLSPLLSPSFKIRQTFATLFENSLLPPFTLERTLDHPFCIHARNHPLPSRVTRAFPISSLFKRKEEKKN